MDITPNQVVAYNLRRARKLHGWTQETAAERLEPYLGERWSRVVFSAAERSITGDRIRQFTADDLVAFAAAFGLPVPFFLTPPRDVDLIAARDAREGLKPEKLRQLAVTSSADERVAALMQERIKEIEDIGIRVQTVPTKEKD